MSAVLNEPAQQLTFFNLPYGSSATETQLDLPKLNFPNWKQLTSDLIKAEASSQWLIGDSLLYGKREFGEHYAKAIDPETMKRSDPSTIKGYLWVSECVPPRVRRTSLRWSHHKEIAKFTPEEQDVWLGRAEELGWTVRELRANIRLLAEDKEETSDLQVLQDPDVRQFFTDHIEILKERLAKVPENAPFAANLIHGQIGQAQWQLDRTEGEEAARVMEAIDEGWQTGTEIFNWLQARSYFMREQELGVRLAWMCEEKRLREVQQGGRKENQRGDLTSIYVRYEARTGDAFTVLRGVNRYDSGEDE